MKFSGMPRRVLLSLTTIAVFAAAALPAAFAAAELIITEIHYHPNETNDPTGIQKYIEVKNIGDEAQNMTGYTFSGIGDVDYINQSVIQPGGFLVIARGNGSGFTNKFGFAPGATFSGNLSQKGETIKIVTPAPEEKTVFSVSYWDGGDATEAGEEDRPLWPSNPDEDDSDYTLVPLRADVNPDPDDFRNWRPSISADGGSPGADEPNTEPFEVFINEVRTRDAVDPDAENDAVEFFNPNGSPVDISDWFLTDNLDDPKRFPLPSGSVVPAGGYLVLENGVDDFVLSLSSRQERVFVYSADGGGNLTGFVSGLHFLGSADGGVTFSRYINSVGVEQYPASPITLGSDNAEPSVGPVVITEIMYDPGDTGGGDEFIEIMNISDQVQPLYDPGNDTLNWRIEGVNYTIVGAQPSLQPGEVALVTPTDPATFRSDHPEVPVGVQIFGAWTTGSSLNNGGEEVALQRPEVLAGEDPAPDERRMINVDLVLYDNAAPWPASADGLGRSLVRIDPAAYGDDPINWQESLLLGGSPGIVYNYTGPEILVNEVLAHTDLPQVDVIELHNPTGASVDIGGWYLTDDRDVPKKFKIPAGTMISGMGYWAVNQDNDGNEGSAPAGYFGNDFQISSRGDSVWVFSADGGGNLSGYRHGFSFRATENGAIQDLTLGRYIDTYGREHFTKQVRSFDVNRFVPNPPAAANNPPDVGPVVISEINFDPGDGGLEFIELKNISGAPVALYDNSPGGNSSNTWSFDGVGFNFPTPTPTPTPTMAADATLLVLPIGSDVAAFRAANSVPVGVVIYGGAQGYTGALNNGGEELVLLRPDRPDDVGGVIIVPKIVVDVVNYRDSDFWPAAGDGVSLEKFNLEGFSDDPINWRPSADLGGTPGTTPEGLFYQLWEVQNFTSEELASSGLTGCDDDFNGDGLPNLFAYAFGYDPHLSPAPASLPQGGFFEDSDETFLTISYRRQQAAIDLLYQPEYSTDLDSWAVSMAQIGSPVDNGDGTETVEFRSGQSTSEAEDQFMRVRVSKQ